MDELSEEDKMVVSRARKVQRFLSQPFFVQDSSQDLRDVMYLSVILFRDLRKSSKVSMMIFQKVISLTAVVSMMYLQRYQSNCQRYCRQLVCG